MKACQRSPTVTKGCKLTVLAAKRPMTSRGAMAMSSRPGTSEKPAAICSAVATPMTPAAVKGAFPDVCKEQMELVDLPIVGSIPDWLAGDLYRTGPGMYGDFKHYFDGFSMPVHFKFENGKVRWNQRFVQTAVYKGWKQTGKPVQGEFGTPLPALPSIWNTLSGLIGLGDGFTDNSSVTVYPGATKGEIVTMTETTAGMYRVRAQTLETIQRVVYTGEGDDVTGKVTTAHPKQMTSGAFVNVAQVMPGGKIEIYTTETAGADRRTVVHRKDAANSQGLNPWMHDLAVAGSHMALVENPLYFDLAALVGLSNADHVVFKWLPEEGTTITVIDLESSTTAPKTFKLPPIHNFHYLNTFITEVEGLGRCMVLDTPTGKTPQTVSDLLLKNLRNQDGDISPLTLKRIILPLDSDKPAVVEDLVTDHASYGFYAELPNINPAFKGKDYSFAYVGSVVRPSPFINQVSKIDVKAKKVAAQWQVAGGVPACEPHFVARPGGTQEDDGVVLCPSIDGEGNSMLVVLDAKDLIEVGRVYTPENFCLGFHSTFIPA